MPLVRKNEASDKPARKAREAKPKLDLDLPTALNVPPEDLTGYSLFLYGDKGIGKTSLAANYPKPLIFMFEPGRLNLKVLQIPARDKKGNVEEPLTWPRFKAYLEKALSSKSVETIIIDTVDRAYMMAQDHVCRSKGISHPNDANDFGKTWKECQFEFESTMNSIFEVGKTRVFISHQRYREVATYEGDTYECVTPTCTDKCWEYIKASFDLAFYYRYVGRDRVMQVVGNDTVWAACGLDDNFRQPNGEPLLDFATGVNAKEAFAKLQLAFDNKLKNYTQPQEKKELPKKK